MKNEPHAFGEAVAPIDPAGSGAPARRVLMLCYYFPPLQTAAVARSVGFARHLPAHGWRPTVLTVGESYDSWGVAGRGAPIPDGIAIERCPEFNLDRPVALADGALSRIAGWLRGRPVAGHWCRELLTVPDPQIGWRARRRGAELAIAHDCVYVSCSPFSGVPIALDIRRRSGRPLIIDFRDAWSLNPHAAWTSSLYKRRIERLERRAITEAERIILNTPGALRLYQRAYPEYADRFVCIPNGYDALHTAYPRTAGDPFTIMHVGTLYGARSPERVLQALAALDLPDTRFVQVGPSHPALEKWRDRVAIEVTGQLAPEEALKRMRSASVLYLRQGFEEGVRDYVAIAAKTYEYLATGLPVLAECPPGDNAEIVSRHAPGARVVTEPDDNAVNAALEALWRERDVRVPEVDPAFVRDFDRGYLTGRLGDVLAAACGHAVTR
ncbi:glycosyltransferase [Halofilum ochraceum]|uniref:glycosyltransferase n=1 Tax=Halofilum ochraceum TaxID=1611323 RepID=UPI0009F30168|nr:glycosyltransferase [Halofilum ochraceum]